MFERVKAGLVAICIAVPFAAAAEGEADRLSRAMRLPEMFEIMAEEGRDYGEEIAAEMFPGAATAAWQQTVARIYDPARMASLFEARFAEALAAAPNDPGPVIAFFESDPGQRIVSLELSARRALLDPAVEEASRARLEEMRLDGDPRLDLIERFVTEGDLVEENVSSALNANFAFFSGLAAAQGLEAEMGESEIIGEVWAQEDAVRGEIDIWIHSYLAMAYAPLSDAELTRYIEISGSPGGRSVTRALFAGFDAVFTDVSRQLGAAAGRHLAGSDL